MKVAGQKVEKKVINASEIVTTQYLDGLQHVQDTLRFFPHAEGYVKNNPSLGSVGLEIVYAIRNEIERNIISTGNSQIA